MPPNELAEKLAAADQLRNDGRNDQAVAAYLAIADQAKASGETAVLAQASHLAGVAILASITSDRLSYYRDAISYFNAAIQAYASINDSLGLANVYRDAAIAHDNARAFPQAEAAFGRSLALLGKLDQPAARAITLDKYGVHFYAQGETARARELITEALQLFDQDPSAAFWRSTTFYDLARLEAKEQRWPEAISHAEEALGWFEADHGEEQYRYRRAQLYGLLAFLNEQANRPAPAKKYLQKFTAALGQLEPAAADSLKSQLENLN